MMILKRTLQDMYRKQNCLYFDWFFTSLGPRRFVSWNYFLIMKILDGNIPWKMLLSHCQSSPYPNSLCNACTDKGSKPDFHLAMPGEAALPMFNKFVEFEGGDEGLPGGGESANWSFWKVHECGNYKWWACNNHPWHQETMIKIKKSKIILNKHYYLSS